ncbi:MAG: NAD(P)/FAD-dependent oxidoreductase [Chitinispirillia bacterium]|nr:NAD(P)/FAD-dependent oxidoreductase [Chitinispirillia bacterium]MCL2242307.1 NAD(P)/FAD-dependent oxidoreductase [Chitinispirillia bacterium]
MSDAANNKYDIIVVGAGPAGSMAAMAAAEAGRRVCLLERKSKAGAPVRCGEGVGFKGLTLSVEPRPEWIKSTLTRARMVSPSGINVEIKNGAEGWILDRERMDAGLAAMAAEKGAELIPNTPVTSAEKLPDGTYRCVSAETGDAREFTAPCLILADGVESRLARGFGWNTALKPGDIESGAFARVKSKDIEPDCCVFYTGSKAAPGGYVWIFPRGEGEANVGLGVIGSRCRPGLPKELLLSFIAGRFPNAEVTDLHCGGIPVARWTRPLVKEGVMLAGDAARQVNAINGAGIAYSLYAGKAAGAAAAKSIRPNGTCDHRTLTEYHRTWAKNYGKQLDRSYALKEFIMSANDAFLDRIAESLSKEDPAKISYLRVFMRAFASKPLLLLKAFKLFK